MSRLADTLLNSGVAYSKGQAQPILNAVYGGMNGYVPQLAEWVNNAPYTRRNLIALLVEAPTIFKDLPDGEYYLRALRSMLELHPTRITGLNAGLQVETDQVPVGGGGQMQKTPTDVKEEASNVVITLNEKYGMPFHLILRHWIQYGIMDPNSKFSSYNTIPNVPKIPDMLPDRYAATMLFIEPDPTHRFAMKAWLVCNLFPETAGEVIGQRDITAPAELVNYDITFGGIAQYSTGVLNFAQAWLDSINLTGANPYERRAFVDKFAPDVLAVNRGYAPGIEQLANDAVRR